MPDNEYQFVISIAKMQQIKLLQFIESLFSPTSLFSFPQLFSALFVALLYLIYRQKIRRGKVRLRAIFRAIFSTRLLFHPSTRVDVLYYFLNSFAFGGLIGFWAISANATSDYVIKGLNAFLGASEPSAQPEWILRAGITMAIFLGYETGYYIDHYMKHRVPALWEVHKTHHDAEVLTPLTLFRVHPLDSLIFINIAAISTGLFHGIFSYKIGRNVSFFSINGVSLISIFFSYTIFHLQHSQFWIPFTGVAGRIFLSPAHHQIHHSIDPEHYNSNYGNVIAVIDWMFGTLILPKKEPQRLKFGVLGAGSNSQPIRLKFLLIDPMINFFKSLRSAIRS